MFRLASLGINQDQDPTKYGDSTQAERHQEESEGSDSDDDIPPLEDGEQYTEQKYRDSSLFDDKPPSGPATSDEYANEGGGAELEQEQGSDADASSTADSEREPDFTRESEAYNQNICGMPVSQFKRHMGEHIIFTNNICYSRNVDFVSIDMHNVDDFPLYKEAILAHHAANSKANSKANSNANSKANSNANSKANSNGGGEGKITYIQFKRVLNSDLDSDRSVLFAMMQVETTVEWCHAYQCENKWLPMVDYPELRAFILRRISPALSICAVVTDVSKLLMDVNAAAASELYEGQKAMPLIITETKLMYSPSPKLSTPPMHSTHSIHKKKPIHQKKPEQDSTEERESSLWFVITAVYEGSEQYVAFRLNSEHKLVMLCNGNEVDAEYTEADVLDTENLLQADEQSDLVRSIVHILLGMVLTLLGMGDCMIPKKDMPPEIIAAVDALNEFNEPPPLASTAAKPRSAGVKTNNKAFEKHDKEAGSKKGREEEHKHKEDKEAGSEHKGGSKKGREEEHKHKEDKEAGSEHKGGSKKADVKREDEDQVQHKQETEGSDGKGKQPHGFNGKHDDDKKLKPKKK